MRVREWMRPLPQTATPDMPIAEARRLMRQGEFRHLPVTEGGQLVGIVSDRDIRLPLPVAVREASLTAADEALGRLHVGDVMTRDVVTIEPDRPVEEGARALLHFRVGAVPVMEEGRVIGILSETDLLRAWVEG